MSESAFRKLRLETGYGLNQLAQILNVTRNTVAHWEQSDQSRRWRPRREHMPRLAEVFGLDTVGEAIRLLWNESVGDLCPCGCAGEKVLPNRNGAKHLYIHLPCKECGTDKARTFRVAQGHVELCKRCSYASRKVKRIPLTCVGYRTYPSGERLRAKRCPGEEKFLPWMLTLFRHKRDIDGVGCAFVDVERKEYCCGRCAGAFRLFCASKKILKRRWKTIHRRPFPRRIRTLDDLQLLQSELTNESDFESKTPPSKTARRHPRPRVIHPAVPARSRMWRREKLTAPIRGLCEICDALLFSYKKSRPMRFHQKCLLKYQREHFAEHAAARNPDGTFSKASNKPIKEQRRQGSQVKLESLQKHFNWARRHKVLKDSIGDIAKYDQVAKTSVVDGIKFILQHLPPPEWVPPQMRQIISALRSSNRTILAEN